MRLNKAGELFLAAQDWNVNERSSWHESLIERSCFHTSASITKIPPQFHSKFTTWDWPKKLEDDGIAHYKSYTSRAELASVLDNEKKFFNRRPGPVKPPRKSRSSKVLNINENPNLNISCVPSNLEKYPHDKLSWVINHNMTTGDPYEKSFYEKPKLEVPSQQSNFNFQYQVNTLTDNFVKHVSLNESPKKSINRNELVRDLVKNNESTHKQSNRNESIRGLVKKNEFTHNLIKRNELAQDSVRDNESVKTPINRNESLKDLVKVQNLMNRNESMQDLLNMNQSNFMTDETTPERVSAASAGKRQDTDTRVDNEPKALGFPDANRFSEKERSADCRVDSYRAYLAKKQEKTDINNSVKLGASANQNRYCSEKKDAAPKTRPDAASRRAARKKKCSESLSGFDVYNIETALPQIDLDAIENHLKAAREEERRRRNDREEIRRRLATGDADDFSTNERPGKKPSLQSRLQSGMNLQICFMNETMSDTESPSSDQDSPAKTASSKASNSESSESPPKLTAAKPVRPLFNNKTQPVPQDTIQTEQDFFAQQAKLQADARQALAEAKETARRQMEIERQRMTTSPITEMLRASLTKVGVPFPEERRRLSRQLLTNMNVAQLQVIVNDLHTQIEILNEDLVKFLMERDELHMGQDSMLVDIEDLTRYLGAKEKSQKGDLWTNNNSDFVKSLTPVPAKPKQTRISPLSMMKK